MTGPAEAFVGRDRELEALRSALDAAGAGSGRLAMLSGEPGIGKTRLARELTDRAAALRPRVVWGRCHEEAGAPPYWPWVRILRAIASDLEPGVLRTELGAGAPDIADLVPELRQRLPDLEPPVPLHDQAEARFRLFGSLTRFLVNLSRRQLLVLVLDDL
jgi:eukaryotic-like serine/threonine-protein kinase